MITSHGQDTKHADLKVTETMKRNSKFFYKYNREKGKIRSLIGHLNVDGKLIEDPERMCKILRSQCDSVFHVDIICNKNFRKYHCEIIGVTFKQAFLIQLRFCVFQFIQN